MLPSVWEGLGLHQLLQVLTSLHRLTALRAALNAGRASECQSETVTDSIAELTRSSPGVLAAVICATVPCGVRLTPQPRSAHD